MSDGIDARLYSTVVDGATRHREDTVALLQELVRVPSVNPYFSGYRDPSREGEVQDILAAAWSDSVLDSIAGNQMARLSRSTRTVPAITPVASSRAGQTSSRPYQDPVAGAR